MYYTYRRENNTIGAWGSTLTPCYVEVLWGVLCRQKVPLASLASELTQLGISYLASGLSQGDIPSCVTCGPCWDVAWRKQVLVAGVRIGPCVTGQCAYGQQVLPFWKEKMKCFINVCWISMYAFLHFVYDCWNTSTTCLIANDAVLID